MIEFKRKHEWHFQVYINDSHCFNITKSYHFLWISELVMECSEEALSADYHRAIADKLDSLNNSITEDK